MESCSAEAEVVDFWSDELLSRLDWKRFEDLTLKLIEKGGFRSRLVERDLDGGALFTVSGSRLRRGSGYLRLAGWRSGVTDVEALQTFYSRLLEQQLENGVFVCCGSFTEEARRFARGRVLELIDSQTYLDTLRRLSLRERDQLLHSVTKGDFTAPSCPKCGAKMKMRDSEAPEFSGKGEALRFSELVAVHRLLRCDSLTVERTARVIFKHGAYCRTMTVKGEATGNFACSGTVEILPGGRIIGTVAAQSIRMHPGGAVDGEMKIKRKGEVKMVAGDEGGPVWGCTAYPKCKMVFDA